MPSRRIAVADCETDPFKRYRLPAPFLWGVYDGERFWLFRTTAEFVAFISTKRWILYAHNGGRFDWHFILDYIDATAYPGSKRGELMVINGRIAQLKIGQCELRDSFNILPVPLASYKKDEIDYAIMEAEVRHIPANWEKICDYLRGDCVYLYELVMKFIQTYGLNLTIAGASMKYWRRLSKQPLPQTDQEFYDALFPYYYGGRVECFEKGIIDASFAVYDINSAYPRAMHESHAYSTTYGTCDGYEPRADFFSVIASAQGAFPYRPTEADAGQFPKNAGLVFPNDGTDRTFHVTKWEFQTALEYGLVSERDVIKSIYFDEHVDFHEYITHFYTQRMQARLENDKAMDLFGKLFMNSLYGKFAANPLNYSNYMICPIEVALANGGDDIRKAGWEFAGMMGPNALVQAPLAPEQMRFYNIATAASITGWVRAYLWRAMRESKGVIYCDTDSIAVRSIGKAHITIGNALGDWKLEGVYKRAGIAGKKLYIFEPCARKEWISAGLDEHDPQGTLLRKTKKATKGSRLTDAEVWEVAAGGEVDWIPEVPTFSPQKAPHFQPRKIRMTAKQRRISRLRALWQKRNLRVRQLELDFSALTQPPQCVLDLQQ